MSCVRMDLVILDELGYLPFSQAGGALLFHLLTKLYEQTSVMITTNLAFEGMVHVCWASQDDHGTAGPPDPPLPHRGDGQRVLQFPAQHAVAKERIKDREQTKKAVAAQVSETVEEGAFR